MEEEEQVDHLFDYFAIIKLQEEGPVIAMAYPAEREMDAKGIAQFCWPEGQLALRTESKTNTENYSFVLTESSGDKRYGYCRRFLRSDPPECFAVVSRLASPGFFAELLNIVELRHSMSKDASLAFISSAWEVPVPDPGDSAIIWTTSLIGRPDPDTYTLERAAHHELLLDHVSFHTLFSLVSLKNILYFFSNMVLERRLILVAENLATLSSCVTAAQSLMQPFQWQHVYIPVLPNSLLDYCTAPMPFFVGVLTSSLPALNTMPLEEVLILDVDNDEFILDPGLPDLIPGPERSVLMEHLRPLEITPDRECNVQIASSFYQFFHSIFRNYGDYYSPKTGRFDLETFMMVQTPQVRKFLQEFETAQIFQGFLQENENPEQRYVFANPADYIQALSVKASKREDKMDRLQGQLSNMGKKMATTWRGVKDALSEGRDSRGRGEARSPRISNKEARQPRKNVLTTLRLKRGGGDKRASASEEGPKTPTHRMCPECHVYTELALAECQTCGHVVEKEASPRPPPPARSPRADVSPRTPPPPPQRTPRESLTPPPLPNKPVPRPPSARKKPPPVPPPPPKRSPKGAPPVPATPPPAASPASPPAAAPAPKKLFKRKVLRKKGKWVKKKVLVNASPPPTKTAPPRPARPANHLVAAAFAHSPASSPQMSRARQGGRTSPIGSQRKCGVCGDPNSWDASECGGCGCELQSALKQQNPSVVTCARCNRAQDRLGDECRYCGLVFPDAVEDEI